jgi:hypothetical protein
MYGSPNVKQNNPYQMSHRMPVPPPLNMDLIQPNVKNTNIEPCSPKSEVLDLSVAKDNKTKKEKIDNTPATISNSKTNMKEIPSKGKFSENQSQQKVDANKSNTNGGSDYTSQQHKPGFESMYYGGQMFPPMFPGMMEYSRMMGLPPYGPPPVPPGYPPFQMMPPYTSGSQL